MIRRLCAAAFVLSLLVCATAVVLWVRSYWVADVFSSGSGNGSTSTGSTRGVLFRTSVGGSPGGSPRVISTGYSRSPAFRPRLGRPFPGDPGVRSQGRVLGFGWFRSDGGTGSTPPPRDASLRPGQSYGLPTFWSLHEYVIPYWFVVLVLGSISLAAWHAKRVQRRRWLRRNNRCTRCGYDLRASAGRCPECGKPITSKD